MRQRIQYSAFCIAIALVGACSDGSRPIAPTASPALMRRFDVDAMTFTSFDPPGSTSTVAMDINAREEIVGRFAAGGVTHGFRRSADGEFTTIDFPGASFTVAAGINDEGDIAGWYALASVPGPLTERHGFLLREGEFTPVDPEGSKFTNALGINARGDIVGRFCTALPCGPAGAGNSRGFLWHNGEATTLDVPGAKETNAWKINSEGEVIGGFRYADGINRLFTFRHGEFTTFDLPGGLPVAQDDGGNNARGDVVGVTCGASPCNFTSPVRHGFVLHDGELTTIEIPGATTMLLLGINARGSMTGAYNAIGKAQGFLLSR